MGGRKRRPRPISSSVIRDGGKAYGGFPLASFKTNSRISNPEHGRRSTSVPDVTDSSARGLEDLSANPWRDQAFRRPDRFFATESAGCVFL
jgi:hypothetical protein